MVHEIPHVGAAQGEHGEGLHATESEDPVEILNSLAPLCSVADGASRIVTRPLRRQLAQRDQDVRLWNHAAGHGALQVAVVQSEAPGCRQVGEVGWECGKMGVAPNPRQAKCADAGAPRTSRCHRRRSRSVRSA